MNRAPQRAATVRERDTLRPWNRVLRSLTVAAPGRRAGFTIIEMMFVVTGTAALIGAGATTLVAVRRVAATAHADAERGAALSRLHRTLRTDAAAATDAAADETGLTFTTADGATVAYAADGAAVVRTVTGADRAGRDRFGVGGTGFAWAADPRPGGTRAAVGFDRAGGPEPGQPGTAVELAAWLGDEGGGR